MKKFLLILMVTIMLTTTSFAAFSDLPEGHWAKGVVDEMVEAGIISGYTDGTFRPTKEISKIESLILLSRVAGLNKYPNEATKYLEQYTSTLSKYTTQYKKDVAYLMGVGVLKSSDLDNLLLADKINTPLTREEMAVLVTKVLGKESEATKNSIVVLPFKDTSSISASAKPYVYYVYTNKIMAGMDSETFSPKTSLTRAQAASVLQRIYKKVDIKPTISETSTPAATSFVTGTITKIDTSASSVWIKSANGEEEYEYGSNTKFYVDSKEVTSAAMKKNATVTATITDDLYITSMNITEGAKITTKTVKGTIYAASSSSKTITVNSNGTKTAYKYDSSTTYTLDGKSSTLTSAIKKDYEITLTVDSTNVIVKAAVTSLDERIIGKIIATSIRYGYVVIEDDAGDEYILMDEYIYNYDEDYQGKDEDYYFDDDTDFKYNGSSKDYDDIDNSSYLYKVGYYLAITLGSHDYIDLIEIGSKKSYLTNEDDDDDNEEYLSSENMLKDNYLVGEIIDIEDDEITIETDDGEEYVIDVLNDAIFLDYTDDDPAYDYIDYLDAYDDEDIYEGDRVLVILCDDDETALIILID